VDVKNRLFFSTTIAFLLFFVISCSNAKELKKFNIDAVIDEAKKADAGKKTKRKESSLEDVMDKKAKWVYNPVGKNDPFKSYFGDLKIDPGTLKKIISPLQRYDVSDLRLTAILWGISEPRAVIVAPNGKSYVVKKGDFMGRNWGKISRILPQKIELIEIYKDPLGRKILNKLYIEMPIKTFFSKEKNVFDNKSDLFDKNDTKK